MMIYATWLLGATGALLAIVGGMILHERQLRQEALKFRQALVRIERTQGF
jgi:hypothetical protein